MAEASKPRRLVAALGRHPFRMALVLIALIGLGFGGYFGGRQVWVWHHSRAAEQAAERRDFQQAYTHISQTLEVRPRDPALHFRAARYARRADRLRDADRHLKACQTLEGVTRDNGFEGALLHAQQGTIAEVQTALHGMILAKHPDSPLILEALAKGYIIVYRLNDAMICLHQLLDNDPVHGPALVMRGRILDAADRTMPALDDFRKAVELYPQRDAWRQELAELLLKHNFPNEALPHLQQLHQRHDEPDLCVDLAQAYRKTGQPDQARRVVDELLTAHPICADGLAERGVLDQEAGRAAEAEVALREAFRLDPTSYYNGYHLYECLGQRGKQQEASELFDHLLKMKADRARVQCIVLEITKLGKAPALRCEAGILCLRQNLDDQGLRWLMSALQDDPAHAPTHLALAEYYERHNQPDPAAYHRRRAEER